MCGRNKILKFYYNNSLQPAAGLGKGGGQRNQIIYFSLVIKAASAGTLPCYVFNLRGTDIN